ncbi:MAG: GntR family transcriptional regulator [Pseudomonas sp.]|uniref:GntR family transcriptional regulator n=1 Tax=Pseudomonas TaxID=286 RepID=UPI0016460D6B|nr:MULTISPECIES: GntR family transcriptional regulator [Pseudomonas]QXI34880.1 GntR family transcriptional regulator [Pseudomonas promysalinigenes]
MPQLSGDVRLPRYQLLRDHLLAQIANNRWRPGEAIATEAALASEFEMSVGTVRKAVDALVAEGVLERQQGRGTFIRRPQFQSSLFRFFRFEAASGERLMPDSQILSVEPVSAPEQVAQALDLPEGGAAIRILRTRSLGAQPVLAEQIWLPRQPFQPLLEVDLNHKGPLLYPIYEELCGQVVASAQEVLTAEAVDAANARLLQLANGSPVVVIERLACNYAGQPLEWRRSVGHAQHFRYRVDIR